ncbi:MAG: 16S rRNA (cytosine(1402)-N(4))-methyltransferase RsmH [Alphaproteobacteria bacterium]|nr:16S rRNA (cytosine(1402)-N(4))-methyltransferase RsmH [Alphaproteobacteria bacterium]
MTAADRPRHIPVMLGEVLAALVPRDGAVYVDATFGAGGYAAAILGAARCAVYGIDRDPHARAAARPLLERFAGRLSLLAGSFGDMTRLLAEAGVESVDGIAFDLGVSSMQLDDPARGFSFRADGPLDMRMDDASDRPSAADIVNRLPEADLAAVIRELGEERFAGRVARAIVQTRARAPFARTSELAETVRRAVPRSKDGIDPATRTFQALRIHVNDELGEIKRGLKAAEAALTDGGRLAVVSFHSLEDRIVKTFLTERSGRSARPSRHLPAQPAARLPTFRLIHGVRKPTPEESAANPRARSARLRAAERTAAPAWDDEERRAA